jgi:hypothetical protein
MTTAQETLTEHGISLDSYKSRPPLHDLPEVLAYAMSLALNRSADVTRQLLIQSTWPQHVVQRNQSFISASVTTRKSPRSRSRE